MYLVTKVCLEVTYRRIGLQQNRVSIDNGLYVSIGTSLFESLHLHRIDDGLYSSIVQFIFESLHVH